MWVSEGTLIQADRRAVLCGGRCAVCIVREAESNLFSKSVRSVNIIGSAVAPATGHQDFFAAFFAEFSSGKRSETPA